MNRRKIVFIFLAGFWLHEVLGHIWLSAEGMLPLTSKLTGFTITPDLNFVFIGVNLLIFFVLAHFAFFHSWDSEGHEVMPAVPR